jgi:hypothetical protein
VSKFGVIPLLVLGLGLSGWLGITVTITPHPGDPVSIASCTLVRQSFALARGVMVEGFKTGVVFKNVTSNPIASVTFDFAMIDTSGAVLQHRLLSSTGTYAPGVQIDNISWTQVNDWPTLGTMDCSVYSVRFVNGESWPAP